MPSKIPNVDIDYKGVIDYVNEKGVAVSELSEAEKNQFIHDFNEIKEQNIKQQKIGQQIMAVRMIQNENKKYSGSGLTIEMLCQGMNCSKEEVQKIVDYTMSFDRRFLADEVVKLCQKEKLIDYSSEEICYYTWFLQLFGSQCINKKSLSKIADKPAMVDTSYTKNESIKLFDSIDSDLISFFVGKTIKAAGYPIMIEEKEILRTIFPDRIPSEKDRNMITERIYKLTHTDIDRFVDGEWSGNIRILGEAQPHKNQGHRIWEYYPSQYIARQIEDGLIMNLPAEVKKELKNEVAKLLYLPFMQQRLRIYREIKSEKRKNVKYKAEFKYLELLRFVNFGYKKKKDGHKAFMDAIEEYKSIQRLIKSYTYSPVRDSYTIMFNELTEMEIMDFDRVFAKDMTEARKISNSILGQVLLSDNVVNEKTTK